MRVWSVPKCGRVVAGLLALLAGVAVRATAAAEPIQDVPFEQEYREALHSEKRRALNDVRSIAADGAGRIWIATREGVFIRQADDWVAPDRRLVDGPAYALETDSAGDVWIGTWQGLFRAATAGDKVQVHPIADVKLPIAAISCGASRVVAGGPDGYWEVQGERIRSLEGPWGTAVQDLLVDGDELWIATQTALFHVAAGQTRRLHQKQDLLSADVRALARGPDGRIWIGSSGGLDVYEKGRRVASYTGHEGLPSTRVHTLKFDSAGTLWVGTLVGMARFDGQRWTLRHSLRWLPNDDVRGVAFDPAGKAWIATSGGVSLLARRTMTLADKAAYFEDIVRQRHVREPGLVRKCRLKTPGDLSTFAPTDTDNDGLFSALYLAAESYRYAVTKDESARRNAAEVYRGLEFLQTVTDTPGFVARTVIPANWSSMADRNRTYTPEQVADERVQDPRFKRVENRWRKSADGRWLWKGDTSSDEISGHYFGYAVYYDLAADEAERARIRAHVRKITDYIIAGGLMLRDIDGQHTLWGVWAPEKLNGDPNWFSERGINSLEILSFLRVAEHMTGDKKYADLARELLEKHNYRANIKIPKLTSPAEFTFIDDQLLALGYRAVFAYSPDDADRAIYRPGLDQWQGAIRQVHSPLYNFVYTIATGQAVAPAEEAAYLRDVPLDLVEWGIDNSRREDITLVSVPTISRRNTSRLLPPSERGVVQWDGNPYQVADGGGGHEECEPHFWLLPYWMGRQHGLIAPPAAPAR
ncbi:MAG: hypothetical protein JNG90_15685 [Planctomycetaceae bacterium]|nr:hypothetical protein [Planctomycetaceae bacterium]